MNEAILAFKTDTVSNLIVCLFNYLLMSRLSLCFTLHCVSCTLQSCTFSHL